MPRDEDLFSGDLLKALKRRLKSFLIESSLEISCAKKVLYDLSSDYYQQKDFAPAFGFLEQDIVISQKLPVPDNLGRYFKNVREKKVIAIPRLIIEVKYRGVSSHALITYSNIAGKIKGIFGDCAYYLVLRYDDKGKETLLRHGQNFDRIFQLQKITSNDKKISYKKRRFLIELKSNEILRKKVRELAKYIKKDISDGKLF